MGALTEIEKLVNEVAKAALAKEEGTIAFHDKVDALKVLTPYYLALRKDHADIAETSETMADFAKALKESHAPLRSRRRNGRASSDARVLDIDLDPAAGT
jgi:hypothetical protein